LARQAFIVDSEGAVQVSKPASVLLGEFGAICDVDVDGVGEGEGEGDVLPGTGRLPGEVPEG
jgi:hypothetical protein